MHPCINQRTETSGTVSSYDFNSPAALQISTSHPCHDRPMIRSGSIAQINAEEYTSNQLWNTLCRETSRPAGFTPAPHAFRSLLYLPVAPFARKWRSKGMSQKHRTARAPSDNCGFFRAHLQASACRSKGIGIQERFLTKKTTRRSSSICCLFIAHQKLHWQQPH